LAEAAIGVHDARRRRSVLAAAELAARSLSCCIRTPYQRASCLAVHVASLQLALSSVIGHGALTALRDHPLLGPRTLGCGYKGRRVILWTDGNVNLVHAVFTGACTHWTSKRADSNSYLVPRAQAGRKAALADAIAGKPASQNPSTRARSLQVVYTVDNLYTTLRTVFTFVFKS
jgi:riboflavin biosynthesis pyrimidine reductase